MTKPIRTFLAASLVLTTAGCELYTKEDSKKSGIAAIMPTVVNRDLDVLFVVDNSGSMREEQDAVAAGFALFEAQLEALEGGLPNLHIGVVSTNMGAGQYGISGCDGDGDGGRLLAISDAILPEGSTAHFLVDEDDGQGGRARNYIGTLGEAFTTVSNLGISGCGFEQPLNAARRALSGSLQQNEGFLRADAQLAVIILSDEDDCSAEDFAVFNSDPAQDRASSSLGFLSSFRCFEFGVVCDEGEPRNPGSRSNCRPRNESEYMVDVHEYANALKSLKANPHDVFVAGIVGDDTPVHVRFSDDEPLLEPSCSSSNGEAAPAIRLVSFLDSFGLRSAKASICNADLSAACSRIGKFLREGMEGSPCLQGPVHSPGTCSVEIVHDLGSSQETRRSIARCDNAAAAAATAASSTLPCYLIAEDAQTCVASETGLAVKVEYGPAAPLAAENVDVLVTCQLDS